MISDPKSDNGCYIVKVSDIKYKYILKETVVKIGSDCDSADILKQLGYQDGDIIARWQVLNNGKIIINIHHMLNVKINKNFITSKYYDAEFKAFDNNFLEDEMGVNVEVVSAQHLVYWSLQHDEIETILKNINKENIYRMKASVSFKINSLANAMIIAKEGGIPIRNLLVGSLRV